MLYIENNYLNQFSGNVDIAGSVFVEERCCYSIVKASCAPNAMNIRHVIVRQVHIDYLEEPSTHGAMNQKHTWSKSLMSIPRAQTSVETRTHTSLLRKSRRAFSRRFWERSLKFEKNKKYLKKQIFNPLIVVALIPFSHRNMEIRSASRFVSTKTKVLRHVGSSTENLAKI